MPRVCCALLIVLLMTMSASAQSTDNLNPLWATVNELFRASKDDEAERIAKDNLSVLGTLYGEGDSKYASGLDLLASLYSALGRYPEATTLSRQSLDIREKALGPNHPEVGASLNRLASIYATRKTGLAEAEVLSRRALLILETALGPDHLDVGVSLNNLGSIYSSLERAPEALPLLIRSLTLKEKGLGPGHPDLTPTLRNLARIYAALGRWADAEQALQRAVTINEEAWGPDDFRLATLLESLGFIYGSEEKTRVEGDVLVRRALAIREKRLGIDHPALVENLSYLANSRGAEKDFSSALEYHRRLSEILIATNQFGGFPSWYLSAHVRSAHLAGEHSAKVSETFRIAQWAIRDETAETLAQMSARFATGDGALSKIIRESQDVTRKLRVLAATMNTTKRGEWNAEREAFGQLKAQLEGLNRRLASEFPAYDELSRARAVDIGFVQEALTADEILLMYLTVPGDADFGMRIYGWAVTKTSARWAEIPGKSSPATATTLRCGLDHSLWVEEKSARFCQKELGVAPHSEAITVSDKEQRVTVLPFSTAVAHEMYKDLLGPFEDLIKGKHLIIVPSSFLTSLPFHVLVTSKTETAIPRTLADYRKVSWLGLQQPMTILPSIGALKALRQFAKFSQASKPFLGVGNPTLEGPQDDPQFGSYYKREAQVALNKQRCPETWTNRFSGAVVRPVASFVKLFRGSQVDIEEVRRWTPLPETADELCEVGRRLGAPEMDILLGARATEEHLKNLSEQGSLRDYRILHFATHGALKGQVQGSAEAGLILTPPKKGISAATALKRDDGFLTVSEIATLNLDADWVVLSACNTAGGEGRVLPSSVSSMASAFFYAGARSLLVSHWEVGSHAAVKLTTRAFEELAANPTMRRGEALRISMRDLISRGTTLEAHPSQWAPFVVMGESRR